MITVIGIRFRNAGKIYYFDPGDKKIARGASVIVETTQGLEMGTVLLPNKEVEDDTIIQPLKPVIRLANDEDFQVIKDNKVKQKEAYKICQEKINKHNLEMKLVDVEYTFDGHKILFYFTANGRIDFRELVKDLASVFKTRIELRQIGVRDETKLLGGVGICGRALCCHTYLSDFVPVSIKMAKEQNLSLNPTKISGVCGRLMCCLKNEEDTYEYLNSKLPNVGDMVIVREENCKATVQDVNVLRQKVKVSITNESGDTEVKEYPVEALKLLGKRKREYTDENVAEAAELEGVETANEADDRQPRREEKPQREREERPRREKKSREERGNREADSEKENSSRGERRGEKNDRQENGSGENQGRNRQENGERGERQNRRDRGEKRNGENGNGENQGRNRQENGERGERQNRRDRGEKRSAENGNGENQGRNRQENGERGERQNRRDRGEKRSAENGNGENQGRNRQENGERSERQNRRDRDRNRQDRSEKRGQENGNGENQNRNRQENGENGEQGNRSERRDRRNRGRRDHRRDNRQNDAGNGGNNAGEN